MIQHHSAIGTTAWTDLLRMLKDSAVSEIRGKPRLKTIRNKHYWYDQYRIGTDVITARVAGDVEEAQLTRVVRAVRAASALSLRMGSCGSTSRPVRWTFARASTGWPWPCRR